MLMTNDKYIEHDFLDVVEGPLAVEDLKTTYDPTVFDLDELLEMHHAEIVSLLASGKDIPLPERLANYCAENEEERTAVEGAYQSWLDDARAWVANPLSASTAYRFIDGHPAFWDAEEELLGGIVDFSMERFTGDSAGETAHVLYISNRNFEGEDDEWEELAVYASSWGDCVVDLAIYAFALFGISDEPDNRTRYVVHHLQKERESDMADWED